MLRLRHERLPLTACRIPAGSRAGRTCDCSRHRRHGRHVS
ncbi:hypothetical protein C7S13_8301 [Burkholderia cepacia]|nr:hypothetical protein [Burkholderia cepacia]